ncbi:Ribosomal silencing factor RsfS [Candidatus Izimaplasma bacterium HR1]|jgi:ribosome-associated protein|uniref:ribosome silencing factor n=1 Tax=Candidatus Izimoplasma sp. HR1 TaxID=1541959 RepID=UPI0004F6B3DC|nr:Ribosomal silencing factor RsfS [Candidatus Izimaplasma bacterium HR1]
MKKIEVVVEALESVNLSDIEIYDMREKSPFFDYLVISSATSDRQLQAAISHITDDLAKHNFPHPRVEGKNSNSWVLIDTKDIVVNVFTKEEREYYDLEKMLVEIRKVEMNEIK